MLETSIVIKNKSHCYSLYTLDYTDTRPIFCDPVPTKLSVLDKFKGSKACPIRRVMRLCAGFVQLGMLVCVRIGRLPVLGLHPERKQ